MGRKGTKAAKLASRIDDSNSRVDYLEKRLKSAKERLRLAEEIAVIAEDIANMEAADTSRVLKKYNSHVDYCQQTWEDTNHPTYCMQSSAYYIEDDICEMCDEYLEYCQCFELDCSHELRHGYSDFAETSSAVQGLTTEGRDPPSYEPGYVGLTWTNEGLFSQEN